MTSASGASWTAQTSGTSDILNGVTIGPNGWVAVGHNSTIITSPNASTWTVVSNPLPTPTILEEVTFGGGQYVAVGWNGTILTSPNGSAWSLPASGTTAILFNVTYGGGQFVAVGQGGTILTSGNAAAWAAQVSGTSADIYGVAYGGGTYVAVGDGGTILYSQNGVNWNPAVSGTNSPLYEVTYDACAGQFVAVGHSGTILSSPNGINWTPEVSGAQTGLLGITAGNGVFVAVGDAEIVIAKIGPCQPAGTPDLEIQKKRLTSPVVAGQPVTYQIIVTNVGTAAMPGWIGFSDPLPAGAANVSYSAPSPWSCTVSGGVLMCTYNGGPGFSLAPGQSLPPVTVTFVVPAGATSVENCARIFAQNPDANPANNLSCDVADVQPPPPPPGGKCAPLPTGAVAWWPLNETSGAATVSDIVGGHTGTPSTMPGVPAAVGSLLGPQPVAGMVNGALLFDRDDWVQVPNAPALNFAGDFTVDAWVYAPAQSPGQYQAIAGKVQFITGGTGAIGYRLYIKNGTIHFELSDGNQVATVTAPGWYAYGAWEFVAAERSGSNLNIYVNGVLAATASLPAGFGSISNSADLLLGQFTTATSPPSPNPYDGWIILDEVEIFNRALTAQELQGLYQAGQGGKCPPGAPDLAITKVQQGPAVVGMTVYYSIYVANVGTASMPGPITVTDGLPAGLILQAVGGGAGSGWVCSPSPPVAGPVTVTCTHPGPVPAGGSLPPITIAAKITGVAKKWGMVINCASVTGPTSGGGAGGTGGVPLDANPMNDKSCAFSKVQKPGKICGHKWYDADGDGVRDPGELGLSGWTIELHDAAGNLVGTATTGKGGKYCYTPLSPGTYTVSEVPQPGWMQTAPQPVPPGSHTVTVASGQTVSGIDFGNRFDLTSWPGWPGGPGGTPGPGYTGMPDLAIQKTAIHVVTGSYIQYAITVTNVGTAPMPMPFTITDTVPWAAFLAGGPGSCTGCNATFSVTGQTMTVVYNSWPPNGPWLVPGQAVTAYVQAFFAWPPPPPGKKVKNCASVSGMNVPGTGIPLDMNGANNHVCVKTVLP